MAKTTTGLLMAPVENLKGFAMSRPPLIIFLICLGLFSIILMTLAFIIKDNELKNPDVSQDWNVFLESFAELEFCIQSNSSSTATYTTSSAMPQPTMSTQHVQEVNWASNPNELRNYSVSMMLDIQPTMDFVNIPHNLTYLTGFVPGSQIGLIGAAANEQIMITMQLPYEWNTTRCRSPVGRSCDAVHIYTCVNFVASDLVFPGGRTPEVCESLNDTGVVYQAQIQGNKPKIFPYWCRSKPVIKINYKLDPTLTVMLSLSDRSLINLHLLHTSYFLFVMTITVLVYAMLRGRPLKMKMTHAMSLSTTTTSTI